MTRSEYYHNSSNISGIDSGVQTQFNEFNKFAEWLPCTPHSLNLVEFVVVEACTEVVNFFGVLQSKYNFFRHHLKDGIY